MSWTPPTKLTVFISFLIMAFGIFIILDESVIFWNDTLLPIISLFGLAPFQSWLLIAVIVIFISWILFYLGVQIKGL